MSVVVVSRLTAADRGDFFALHSEANGHGWCRCVAWWVPTWEGWGERTAQENRCLREALFDRGEHDGYLLREDGEPRAWCQAGRVARLDKLTRQFALDAELTGAETWAVTCFFVAPAARRRGLARALLDAVLGDLRARGAARVLAFPKRGEDLDAGELWTGPEPLLRARGFTALRDDPARPVLALDLGP